MSVDMGVVYSTAVAIPVATIAISVGDIVNVGAAEVIANDTGVAVASSL